MYPVTLEIKNRRCLVVGGGGVALRKIQGLVEEGAAVTVVAPEVAKPIELMASRGEIKHQRRPYDDDVADGWALVIAATDDREVNKRVYREAEDHGVWCNVADDPEFCSFHLPARVRRGPFQMALSSAGEAPFAVARLRRLLERRFGQEWGEWLEAAARFRRSVRPLDLSPSAQSELYDRFFEATVDGEGLTARVPTEAEEREWLDSPVDHTRAVAGAAPEPVDGCRKVPRETGFVALVGSGPGCPGLLTVRGRRRLAEADVVVFDRLAAGTLPTDLAVDVELPPVGKVAGNHPTPQTEINALLVRLAREGKRVVRLKGGDPYVFGRGGEEAEVLAREGIPFEVVPGVTSGVAALAWAGIPATHRRESVRLTLLTAHEAIKSDGPQVRWDLLAQDEHATLVGYMGVTALPTVVERLLEAGMAPDTPAAMVEQGTTSAQRQVVSTLSELTGAIAEAGLEPPALFAIGPTVSHARHLDWFGALPLSGQRLVTTATNAAMGPILEDRGAEVLVLPVPVTPAARIVMSALPLTGCVVRSRADVDWLDDERSNPGWTPESVAWCIGREAADRARQRGWLRVVELEEGMECEGLVARIADSDGTIG